MDKKNISIVLLILLAAVVMVAVWLSVKRPAGLSGPVPPVGQPGSVTEPPVPAPEAYVPKDGKIEPLLPLEQQADYIIDITSAGFSPEVLKIKKGNSVIWTNRDRYAEHSIMSVGEKYPESGDCGTKIDSCAPMKLGESFRATLSRSGAWEYQDKLNPKFTGTIIVE